MNFICSCMLEAEGSRMGAVYGHSEDMMRLPRVNDIEFPSRNMSVACLDSSIENQKGGYIKPSQIMSQVHCSASGTSIVSEWHLVSS